MRLKTGTWVAVADGGRAMILVNIGTAFTPELKVRRTWDQDNPRTHEQGRDRPPRTFNSADMRRSALEAADLHQTNEDRFIGQFVGELEADATAGLFRELAVFAPPAALGRFRKAASEDLARRVIAWVDKDLTKLPVPEITAAVARSLQG